MSLAIEIRPFQIADAETVIKLIIDNLVHINSKCYSEQQINGFITYFTKEKMIELSKDSNRLLLVATSNNLAVGTATLLNDEIRMVYVDLHVQGKGVGKNLIERIEKIAKDKGIAKLHVNSSLNAIGFYEKLGFKKGNQIISNGAEVLEMSKII